MSDSEEDFDDPGQLSSDTDTDQEQQHFTSTPLSGDEDADMPEIEDGEIVTELLTSTVVIKAEPEKSKRPQKRLKRSNLPKLGKKPHLTICAVPGCKSKLLLSMGVKLATFQVPQPTDGKYNKVWLKWLHALGFSSSEEASKTCSAWARICELHFTEECFIKDYESDLLGKKPRQNKRLVPGSYPTLNVPIPEEVLEDPRLVFHLDPIISEKSASNDPEKEKSRLKAKIIDETEIRVQQELAKQNFGSVIPNSLSELNKGAYERRVRDLIAEAGISHPPTFLDDLHRKLGIKREDPAPKPVKLVQPAQPAAALPPCTILRPLAKPGEPPLPAIMIPGLDHSQAVKLLEDPNIQDLLKTMADKHKQNMAEKMGEEGDEEVEEEFVNENGEKEMRSKKKEIPPPPMIILQPSNIQSALSGNSTSQSNSAPDIVQQALDKTFNTLPRPSTSKAAITRPPVLGVITIGKPPPRPVPRWAHENFLESLPPIDSKFILNDAGNVETMSSVDHDYGQGSDEKTGIPIFDPTGLRQEVEMWRMEVESLRRKNFELKLRLIEGRYNKKAALNRSGYKNISVDRKKLEKLEMMNQKLQVEVVQLKLERRRMMNKERNRKRKRQKVLERRQKRRDWIMEQIELGNMTKEHLELVYSRKKLPYEKKNGAPTTTINSETMTLITIPGTIKHDNDETMTTTMVHTIPETSMTSQKRRVRQKPTQNLTAADLSGITSVVVQQHHELQDENAVAVSGIPGVVISSGGIHGGTHQIIVEGGEEYTNEQLDFIVKAVDDMEASGWKVASPRHFQQRHY